jgi:DNA-binding helix-hairpin-helix protein with protein kinase domain
LAEKQWEVGRKTVGSGQWSAKQLAVHSLQENRRCSMQTVVFGDPKPRTRQVLLWAVLLQVLFALSAGLLYILGGLPLTMVVQVLSAAALVLYCLALAYFLVVYLRSPEVKQKSKLKALLRQNKQEYRAAQAQLAKALQSVEPVRAAAQIRRENEQVLFDATVAVIDAQIEELNRPLVHELSTALAAIQTAHLNAGLKAVFLEPAAVPGIGELLGEKLRENGILTAYDVTEKNVKSIQGIGKSKATSLIWWRESYEKEIQATQPLQLPEVERQAIEERHIGKIKAQQDEKDTLTQAHQRSLASIQAKTAEAEAAVQLLESETRLQQDARQRRKDELLQELKTYNSITFLGLLSAALANPRAGWQKRIQSSLLLVVLAFAATLNVLILLAALFRTA